MKNLFNNISQEEKNRILEMHSGNKNIILEQPQNCVTSNEIVDLLMKFKFKVVDQNSAMIVLECGATPKMSHNIKKYVITIMVLGKDTIKFDKITQSEINSPIPKEPFNFIKRFCDFKTINDFRRFVIDKFLDL
jgi:hypothetical protein